MPRKPRSPSAGVDPVALALAGLLAIAAWCAWRVIVAARAVVAAAEDKDTYVLLITDDGLKSDNQRLAQDVNEGLAALKRAESEAGLLILICGVIAVCLVWRVSVVAFKKKTPTGGVYARLRGGL